VAERGDPAAVRWLIGVELAGYRKLSGVSRPDAAKAVGVSSGMVGHFESGRYFPSPEQIARLLETYGVPGDDVERLSTLAGRADSSSWLTRWADVIPDWARTYIGLEGLASHVIAYSPFVLHALVQTAEYSAGVTSPSARVRPDQQDRLVALRMERQRRVLGGDRPPRFTALVEESVLHRPIGGGLRFRTVMRDQLRHLLTLGEKDNVRIRVLPTSIGRHDGLEGRFTVLHFRDADGKPQGRSIGYVEIPDDAVYIQEEAQVQKYTTSADLLCAAALSHAESLDFVSARIAALE